MKEKKDDKIKKEQEEVKKPIKKDKNKKFLFDKDNKPKFNVYWIYGIIALLFIGLQFFDFSSNMKEINWLQLDGMLKAHDVEKIVVVNEKKAEIHIIQDKFTSPKYDEYRSRNKDNGFNNKDAQLFYNIGSVDIFAKQMEKAQVEFDETKIVPVNYETRKDHFGELLSWLMPIIILVAIWIFIFKRMSGGGMGGGGIFSIGKSKAKEFDKEEADTKTTFKDVAGLEEAKVEVTEIVDFLKKPEKYTKLGGKIPKGALLVGPPGTGKTLLAKAVAGEAEVPFFSMSGSDFVEMFVGVGASRVRDLFAQAKKKAPCIIFIDEIDAVGRARGKGPNFGSNDERESTLNQLLTEMDGFGTNAGVILLAATNRADVLDNALLRAGRFDRQIHVELPDLRERAEIFKVHLKPINVKETLDIDFLARQTPGFSGADIANICNEAALIAARKEKEKVEKQDFLDAVDRVIGGLEKKKKLITPTEKKTIAFHEAGHATISWLLEYAHPLVKVTIVPRGQALGAAWYLPKERQITTYEQILDEMCSALGGRVAEEITFGKISTGALNDLEKVTKQSYAMVSYFGMSSKIGNLSFYDSSGNNEYSFNKPYSEKTAETIDNEASLIIAKQYQRAKQLLLDNKKGFEELANLLLEKEVIFSDDVEKIFGKREFVEEEAVSNFKLPKEKSNGDNKAEEKNIEKQKNIENN